MARGAAGIAYALLVLAGICGDERFSAAALDAMAYERSLFSPVAGNWPDLRRARGGDAPRFRTAWCHGAPGIGLARLRSLPYIDDPAIRAEIDAALATTLAAGFGRDHSLCHGDLGRLELLLAAAEALDQPRWWSHVQHMAAGILGSAAASDGWLCGVPLGVETPGLMTGLAGIGYELLRVAEPARVPSVLALAPPPTAIA
jgi:lantibiotic modifying enzyme